jgi:DNA-binding Lrp family transcriptional regulator
VLISSITLILFPFPPVDKGEIKMAISFVLMHVSPLHESEVFNKLSKLQEIMELHQLFGEYDLIAKIEAEDYESIGKIIINKIRTIDGIVDTKTLTGICIF